jgi:hypothetical protein
MHALFTNLFLQASVNDNGALAAWKRQFIELFSLIGFLTCFITGLIPNSQYNTLVLLLAGACFAVLGIAFRRGLNWFWAVNLIMLVASCLLLHLIFVTGGTASVLMIWIAGLSLMPFIFCLPHKLDGSTHRATPQRTWSYGLSPTKCWAPLLWL